MTFATISFSSVTAIVAYPTHTSRFQITCFCITFGNVTECSKSHESAKSRIFYPHLAPLWIIIISLVWFGHYMPDKLNLSMYGLGKRKTPAWLSSLKGQGFHISRICSNFAVWSNRKRHIQYSAMRVVICNLITATLCALGQ